MTEVERDLHKEAIVPGPIVSFKIERPYKNGHSHSVLLFNFIKLLLR